MVFLSRKASQRDQNGGILGDAQFCPQLCLALAAVLRRAEGGQVDAGGHRDHGAAHAVAVQQHPHLLSGGQQQRAVAGKQPGGILHRGTAQPLTGEHILGVVLVDGVVSMHDGAVAALGQPPRHHEGGKFTLRMDDFRAPGGQLIQPLGNRKRTGRTDPDVRVDHLGPQTAHIDDAVFLVGMVVLRKRHHPDIVAQGQQLMI